MNAKILVFFICVEAIIYLSLYNLRDCTFKHGAIIGTRITCKKMPCYTCDSACSWLIVENAKIFRSYVKHFLIFPRERNCRVLIGLCKEVFMNHSIIFLDRDTKGKLVPASFSYFLELL